MPAAALRLDETHDPSTRSWVESAQFAGTDFPIQNLPYGVFSRSDETTRHVGVAIGEEILDLTMLEASGLLDLGRAPVFASGSLNPLMALPPHYWRLARERIFELLREGVDTLQGSALAASALAPQNNSTMHLPFEVKGFTDFYSSREHATNVGTLFRGPADALPPNWLHLPIAYNGRASTVVVSGTPIRRPCGQLKQLGSDAPALGPSARLDMEVELGAVVGTPSKMGTHLTANETFERIFGYVLLNDWSARDIQFWEYRPLGPFQSKAFATTISPWVVTRQALEPYRVAAPPREVPLLPYLRENQSNNLDIHIEARLAPMAERAHLLSRTNARTLYFSSAVQLAHHTLCGCAMETGDLLGSGTISGPTPDSLGSLLEMTENGARPVRLGPLTRTFLEDGDMVTLSGWCEGRGHRIGFGEASGAITPAVGC